MLITVILIELFDSLLQQRLECRARQLGYFVACENNSHSLITEFDSVGRRLTEPGLLRAFESEWSECYRNTKAVRDSMRVSQLHLRRVRMLFCDQIVRPVTVG